MKVLYPMNGIVTVLNTPFTDLDTIDLVSLKKHIKVALDAGVAGFLVPAMASEVYKLTLNERLKIIETVLESVDGRVPVIGGAGEANLDNSLKLLKLYLDLGCRNVLFQIPFHDEAQFKTHFMKLADLEPEMIMLQDWDSIGYGLPDHIICELFEQIETFRCLKIEIVPAGIKYTRILELTEGRLNISGGWAVGQMMEALDRGVHAFMPTGMHYIYTQIYRYYIEGKHEEAEKLFHQILPVLAFSNQHLDISIHFFKRLIYRQGIYSTFYTRRPILSFDNIHERISDKLINKVIEIENQVKDTRK